MHPNLALNVSMLTFFCIKDGEIGGSGAHWNASPNLGLFRKTHQSSAK